jgi:hypothetical protein
MTSREKIGRGSVTSAVVPVTTGLGSVPERAIKSTEASDGDLAIATRLTTSAIIWWTVTPMRHSDGVRFVTHGGNEYAQEDVQAWALLPGRLEMA